MGEAPSFARHPHRSPQASSEADAVQHAHSHVGRGRLWPGARARLGPRRMQPSVCSRPGAQLEAAAPPGSDADRACAQTYAGAGLRLPPLARSLQPQGSAQAAHPGSPAQPIPPALRACISLPAPLSSSLFPGKLAGAWSAPKRAPTAACLVIPRGLPSALCHSRSAPSRPARWCIRSWPRLARDAGRASTDRGRACRYLGLTFAQRSRGGHQGAAPHRRVAVVELASAAGRADARRGGRGAFSGVWERSSWPTTLRCWSQRLIAGCAANDA
jgi:hypothetical protein